MEKAPVKKSFLTIHTTDMEYSFENENKTSYFRDGFQYPSIKISFEMKNTLLRYERKAYTML